MFSLPAIELENYELLVFASPEPRCLHGLKTIPTIGTLQRAWIIEFSDYNQNQPADSSQIDIEVFKKYHQNLATLHEVIGSYTPNIVPLTYRLNLLEPFDDQLGSPSPFNHPLVVDISCAPRGHLLALLNYLARCQSTTHQRIVMMYSIVQRQAEEEESYSFGMQDVAVVPGFNGRIRLKHDLLIIVLGFEGNRAFSLYRRLDPNKTYLILGDSSGPDRDFYIERAKKNNHSLLHSHGNKSRFMSSRDPRLFAFEFGKFLREEIQPLVDRYNVYFSCLGTKTQTVGAFLAIQSHPYIQVVDALPTKRRIASEGEKETLFADFGSRGLLNPDARAT